MEDISDAVIAQLGTLATYLPLVAVAGLGIALILWGGPKLVGFFRRMAK